MHLPQLESPGAHQVNNPWSSRSSNHSSFTSAVTTGNSQRRYTDSVFHDDPIVSSGFTTWRDRDMILDPEPPPRSAQPTSAQAPIQGADMTQTSTHVASLKAIFPDFDDALIISVLESTSYDHDRALDVLLGMNDPSFIPPTLPPAPMANQFQSAPSSDAQRRSQEALDEQLARRLAFEEEQAATPPWQTQRVEGHTTYLTYQPRRGGGRNSWSGSPQGLSQTQGQGGRDTMSEFQEGFNRIAESGKKTFSSIVSKFKSKMQEFEQGRSQNPPPEQLASPQSGQPSDVSNQEQDSGQGAYTQPASLQGQTQTGHSQLVRTSTHPSSPPRSGVLRPAAAEPAPSLQPSYYDPNSQGYDLYGDDEEIQILDKTTSAAAPATTQSPATPLHTDRTATPPPPSDTSSLPSYSSPVSPTPAARMTSVSPPPTRSLSPTITGAKGTAPGTPGGVDFSKLGLLPKRPISLVRPQSPPVAGVGASAGATNVSAPRVATAHSESTTADSLAGREESEFVENPFEDPK